MSEVVKKTRKPRTRKSDQAIKDDTVKKSGKFMIFERLDDNCIKIIDFERAKDFFGIARNNTDFYNDSLIWKIKRARLANGGYDNE